MARSAGYVHVHEFSELTNFEQQAAHVLKQDGPVFATLHVERSKPLTYDYANLYDPARRVAAGLLGIADAPGASSVTTRRRRSSCCPDRKNCTMEK